MLYPYVEEMERNADAIELSLMADDAQLRGEIRVTTVEGDPDNTKVTFIEDLIGAEQRAGTWDETPGGTD